MLFKFNPLVLLYFIVIGTPVLLIITYLVAAWQGHVPWCFPPIQGCTDITHTGLNPPESYIFRMGLIPIATFMGFLFYFFKEWLEALAGGPSRNARIAFYLAVASSVCLVAGTSFIQGSAQTHWTLHTIFASLFFVLMLISQILYTYEERRLRPGTEKTASRIRLGANLVQIFLLLMILFQLITGIGITGSAFEWLLTFSFIAWYAAFLFERNSIFKLDKS